MLGEMEGDGAEFGLTLGSMEENGWAEGFNLDALVPFTDTLFYDTDLERFLDFEGFLGTERGRATGTAPEHKAPVRSAEEPTAQQLGYFPADPGQLGAGADDDMLNSTSPPLTRSHFLGPAAASDMHIPLRSALPTNPIPIPPSPPPHVAIPSTSGTIAPSRSHSRLCARLRKPTFSPAPAHSLSPSISTLHASPPLTPSSRLHKFNNIL